VHTEVIGIEDCAVCVAMSLVPSYKPVAHW